MNWQRHQWDYLTRHQVWHHLSLVRRFGACIGMKRNMCGGVAIELVVSNRRHHADLEEAIHAVLQGVCPRGDDTNADTNTSTAPDSAGDVATMASLMPNAMPSTNIQRMPMPIAEPRAA